MPSERSLVSYCFAFQVRHYRDVQLGFRILQNTRYSYLVSKDTTQQSFKDCHHMQGSRKTSFLCSRTPMVHMQILPTNWGSTLTVGIIKPDHNLGNINSLNESCHMQMIRNIFIITRCTIVDALKSGEVEVVVRGRVVRQNRFSIIDRQTLFT